MSSTAHILVTESAPTSVGGQREAANDDPASEALIAEKTVHTLLAVFVGITVAYTAWLIWANGLL